MEIPPSTKVRWWAAVEAAQKSSLLANLSSVVEVLVGVGSGAQEGNQNRQRGITTY